MTRHQGVRAKDADGEIRAKVTTARVLFFMNERVLVLLNPEKTRGQADKNIYANSDNMDGKATSLYGQFLINSVLNKSLLIHTHKNVCFILFTNTQRGEGVIRFLQISILLAK
jgi:hypothetical protein